MIGSANGLAGSWARRRVSTTVKAWVATLSSSGDQVCGNMWLQTHGLNAVTRVALVQGGNCQSGSEIAGSGNERTAGANHVISEVGYSSA